MRSIESTSTARRFTQAMLVALTTYFGAPSSADAQFKGSQAGFEWVMPERYEKYMESKGVDAISFGHFCNSLFAPIIFDTLLRNDLSRISAEYRGVTCFAFGIAALQADVPLRAAQKGEVMNNIFKLKSAALKILREMKADRGFVDYLETKIPDQYRPPN